MSSVPPSPTHLGTVKVLVLFEQFICLLDCHFIIAIIEIICRGRAHTQNHTRTPRPFWKATSNFTMEHLLPHQQQKPHFPCAAPPKPNIQETVISGMKDSSRCTGFSHSNKQAFVITPHRSLQQQKRPIIERILQKQLFAGSAAPVLQQEK